jgi:integrase
MESPSVRGLLMVKHGKTKLTDRFVESLKPEAVKYRVADVGETGLSILVHPTGRKVWTWRGYINRQLRSRTLGAYPAHSLADGREWARAIQRGRDRGIDVVEEENQLRLEQVRRLERTLDWLFEKYMENEGGHVKSAREKRRLYQREISPVLGSMSIFDIQHDHLANILQGKVSSAPSVSNHLQSLIKRLFRWSVTHGRHISGLTADPASHLVKLSKAVPRRRFLDDYELGLLLAVLSKGNWKMGAPLRLILYTGTRRSEAFGARWSEFDLNKGLWIIPQARAKNGQELLLPLPEPALALINRAEPFVRVHDLIWPGYGDPEKPMSGFSKALAGILSSMQTLASADGKVVEPWTIHDLRRSVATGMNGLHDAEDRPLIPWIVIERVMNHKLPGMQGVYNRWEYIAEKRSALRLWAEHLERLAIPRPG